MSSRARLTPAQFRHVGQFFSFRNACNKTVRIYQNQKICQVKFEYTTGNVIESYDKKAGSKYHNQSGVVESKMHKNF